MIGWIVFITPSSSRPCSDFKYFWSPTTLLNCGGSPIRFRGARDRLAVQRLDRVHAQQADAQSLAGQLSGHTVGGREHAPAGDEREVRAVSHGDRATESERRLVDVDLGLARLAQAPVSRSVER